MSQSDDLLISLAAFRDRIEAEARIRDAGKFRKAASLIDQVLDLLDDSPAQRTPSFSTIAPGHVLGSFTYGLTLPDASSSGLKRRTGVLGSYTYGLSFSETTGATRARRRRVLGSYTYGLTLRDDGRVASSGADVAALGTVVVKDAPLPDNLTRIKGISADIASALNAKHITRFEQIVGWTAHDVTALSEALGLKLQISRECWIEQAAILAAGGHTAYDRALCASEPDSVAMAKDPRTLTYDAPEVPTDGGGERRSSEQLSGRPLPCTSGPGEIRRTFPPFSGWQSIQGDESCREAYGEGASTAKTDKSAEIDPSGVDFLITRQGLSPCSKRADTNDCASKMVTKKTFPAFFNYSRGKEEMSETVSALELMSSASNANSCFEPGSEGSSRLFFRVVTRSSRRRQS